MAKPRGSEYIVTDNAHGTMFFGPGGPANSDEGKEFKLAVASGSQVTYKNDGSRDEIIPGRTITHCGSNLKQGRDKVEDEQIAYAVVCDNGDLVFTAPSGNIKFLAKNIYVETRGSNVDDGVFLLKANGGVTIDSGEQLTLSGTKVCVRGQAEVNIASDHFINIVGELMGGGSPLSSVLKTILPGVLGDLLDGVASSCK